MRNFSELLAFGEEGEQIIAEMLIEKGAAVLPLYQFKNHDNAPFMLTESEKITLPDLCCWLKGNNFFVECKRKNQWVKFKGQTETGLNEKHFYEYEKIKAITGKKVYIFFIHEGIGEGIYWQEIEQLRPYTRKWNGCLPTGKKITAPMVLFPKGALKTMAIKAVQQ